jgi:hypothetical protein
MDQAMRLVTVATFDNTPAAHVAKSELAAAGIQAVVTDETVVSQLWHIGALNGMKLQVAEENVADARSVLYGESDAPDARQRTEWRCLNCLEVIEPDFDVCWSCGSARADADDPAFVPPASEPPLAHHEAFAGNELHAGKPDPIDPGNPYAAGRAQAALDEDEELPAASEAIEETVIRAWRASVIGLGLFPVALHAYSLGLLGYIALAGSQLSAAGKLRFVAALVIDLLVLGTAAMLLVWAFTGA